MESPVAQCFPRFLEADRGDGDRSNESQHAHESNSANGSDALERIRNKKRWRQDDDEQIEPRIPDERSTRRGERKLAHELDAEGKPHDPVQSGSDLADAR